VEKINMVFAISSQGTCHFLCYDKNMTQQLFIDFMGHLVEDSDRKVLFIVDNLKVHHGKIAAEWLSGHKEEIELFFLIPYSLEINPDEYLNHNLKQKIHSGILPCTGEQNHKKTNEIMQGLQKEAEKVANFFKHKKLKYIQVYGN